MNAADSCTFRFLFRHKQCMLDAARRDMFLGVPPMMAKCAVQKRKGGLALCRPQKAEWVPYFRSLD